MVVASRDSGPLTSSIRPCRSEWLIPPALLSLQPSLEEGNGRGLRGLQGTGLPGQRRQRRQCSQPPRRYLYRRVTSLCTLNFSSQPRKFPVSNPRSRSTADYEVETFIPNSYGLRAGSRCTVGPSLETSGFRRHQEPLPHPFTLSPKRVPFLRR